MINLLSKEKKRAIKKQYRLRALTVTLLLFFVLGLLSTAFLVPSYFLSRAKEQVVITEKEILDEQYEGAGITGLEETITEFNTVLTYFSDAEPKKVTDRIFSTALSQKPDTVRLYAIGYRFEGSTGEVELSGIAGDRESLLTFTNALEGVEHFSGVELPVSNLAQNRDIPFEITFVVEEEI